jgi:hypothetical protein
MLLVHVNKIRYKIDELKHAISKLTISFVLDSIKKLLIFLIIIICVILCLLLKIYRV